MRAKYAHCFSPVSRGIKIELMCKLLQKCCLIIDNGEGSFAGHYDEDSRESSRKFSERGSERGSERKVI